MKAIRDEGSRTAADCRIAARIRERRRAIGLTQRELAEAVGVVTQQIFKYEHGHNSVSAGLLYEIARSLNASPDYFFEGLPNAGSAQLAPHLRALLDLLHNFEHIKSREQQKVIGQLIRTLAKS
jgi:transcriptional regulator with XRE-family HTH domain